MERDGSDGSSASASFHGLVADQCKHAVQQPPRHFAIHTTISASQLSHVSHAQTTQLYWWLLRGSVSYHDSAVASTLSNKEPLFAPVPCSYGMKKKVTWNAGQMDIRGAQVVYKTNSSYVFNPSSILLSESSFETNARPLRSTAKWPKEVGPEAGPPLACWDIAQNRPPTHHDGSIFETRPVRYSTEGSWSI